MTLIAADTANLGAAADTLRSSGVGDHLAGLSLPSFGDGAADAASAGFCQALGARMALIDQMVGSAGTLVGHYTANFEQVGS